MSSIFSRKILFSNLSYKTTEIKLVDYFSTYGTIEELNLDKDDQDQSLRQGFLVYKDIQSIDKLMFNRPHSIDNRQIHVQRSINQQYNQNLFEQLANQLTVYEIFINRLYSNEKRQMFINYFQRFGSIVDCRVIHSYSNSSTRQPGYAFIRFHDYDTVDRIILSKPHLIQSKYYHIRKSIPKEYNYILSSIKPLSQHKPIWQYYSLGLIHMKTHEIIYPPSSSTATTNQQSKKERTIENKSQSNTMQRSVSNDFEILETNSLSSSSISIVQSIDDLTPLPSPVYPTTNIDNDDRHSFDFI